jgi:hypothetical protein
MERLEWLGVLAKQVLSQMSYTYRLARVGKSSGSSFASVDLERTAALSSMRISRMTRGRVVHALTR